MYCTQCLLHKLPILITLTLNINDLCEGADCILFCCSWGFLPHHRCQDQNIALKHFNWVHYAGKLVMKAELPHTPASQAVCGQRGCSASSVVRASCTATSHFLLSTWVTLLLCGCVTSDTMHGKALAENSSSRPFSVACRSCCTRGRRVAVEFHRRSLFFFLSSCCKAENVLRCILSHGWRPAPLETIYCRYTSLLSIKCVCMYVCI